MKTLLAAAVLTAGMAMAGVSGIAAAQQGGPGSGPGYGRGAMMGGGWGPGAGGPGMMGGYGPGMMRGGSGWGGAGYGGPVAYLDLNDEQREKIARIQEENRTKNWNAMGQIRTEQFKLRQMYVGDKVDSKAYVDQQRKVDELRRAMLTSRIETRNQIDAVLTKEQRQQFRSYGPWWLQEDGIE
jgi:Spy/CpxP family protein refolding chaperone